MPDAGAFNGSSAGKSYMRNGSIIVQDDDGHEVLYVGMMSDGVRRGIEILDHGGDSLVALGDMLDGSRGLQIESSRWPGVDLVKMTTAGTAAPHLTGVSSDPTAVKTVTSGTFTDTWQVTFGSVLGTGVEVMIPWSTGAATTGQLQVVSNVPSHTQSVDLPAGSSGYKFVRWIHGADPGTGPLVLIVQALRSSGAGTVSVFPCQAWVTDPLLCFDGGNWL
jgi:hypothetical protein